MTCYSVYVCSNCGAEIQVKHNEKLPCYCKNCESECEEQSAEMTTEKLETAVKNMNCIIEELRNDDDTFTITIKVLKSIKANYEELIKHRSEIERLNYIIARDNQRQTEKEQKDGNCILTLYELYDKEVADNKKFNAEIEKLKNECFCIANERDAYKDILDTAVTEAIEEFADRLKMQTKGLLGSKFIEEQVNKLLKETAGADNA